MLLLQDCNDYISKNPFLTKNYAYLFSQQCIYTWELLSTTSLVLLKPVKHLWNKCGGQRAIQHPPTIKSFFSFISSAQILLVSVTDPVLLHLSYFKSIVQVHNGGLCAFSLLSILNSRPPALSLQYVQCK